MTTLAYPNQQATFTGDRRHTQPLIAAYLYRPTAQDAVIPQRPRTNEPETASVDTQGSLASTVSLIKRKIRRAKH